MKGINIEETTFRDAWAEIPIFKLSKWVGNGR
jgi:hypothetical protein